MATWDDVREITGRLPESQERESGDGIRQWRVRDKLYVWERPLRTSDLAALGDEAPEGPILAARVEDVGAKEALVADDPAVYFTTPHFDGYPAVLVRLDRIDVPELTELVLSAWLHRAPKRLSAEYLRANG